jgi:hypothetical protein
MVNSSHLSEAHEPRLGEFGEFASHFILVVPVPRERRRSAGDVRGARA